MKWEPLEGSKQKRDRMRFTSGRIPLAAMRMGGKDRASKPVGRLLQQEMMTTWSRRVAAGQGWGEVVGFCIYFEGGANGIC